MIRKVTCSRSKRWPNRGGFPVSISITVQPTLLKATQDCNVSNVENLAYRGRSYLTLPQPHWSPPAPLWLIKHKNVAHIWCLAKEKVMAVRRRVSEVSAHKYQSLWWQWARWRENFLPPRSKKKKTIAQRSQGVERSESLPLPRFIWRKMRVPAHWK